ncbi:MAG: choice-of-anchor tandem repeat NxxGxxAF-containing protein [Nostoc sp.]
MSGFSEVGINNTGTVIFDASRKDGKEGIFTGNGETITTIADISSSFSRFIRNEINDNNQLAFGATLRNGAKNVFIDGIFTGSDPIADKVIGIGDSLLGGTVTNLFFGESINNSGQIPFFAELIDDSGKTITGVFCADPVSKSIPESTSTLNLLAFSALSTGLTLKGKLKQKLTVRINNL